MKQAFILFTFCVLFALPALAAKERKPPDVQAITAKAEAGDAKAEEQLGNLYHAGKFVVRDDVQAARWYQKAVDQGNAQAEVSLGHLYLKGEGVPRDEAKAASLFQAAADQGLPSAEESMGGIYAKGDGVRFSNDKEAADWYRKAADQNDADAQDKLGDLYFKGSGVQQSYEDADLWYHLAARHKLGKGMQKRVTKHVGNADRLLNSLQAASVQKRLEEWKPVAHAAKP